MKQTENKKKTDKQSTTLTGTLSGEFAPAVAFFSIFIKRNLRNLILILTLRFTNALLTRFVLQVICLFTKYVLARLLSIVCFRITKEAFLYVLKNPSEQL